jgi:hypothetical protein
MAREERRILIRDLKAAFKPTLQEPLLRNPNTARRAVMDYTIPEDASPELLRQAARCVLEYIGLLLDERRSAKATADRYVGRRGEDVKREETDFEVIMDRLNRHAALELLSTINEGLSGSKASRERSRGAACEAYNKLKRLLHL